MSSLKIVAIVSADPSDIYFANRISHRINLAGIVVETPRPDRNWQKKFKKAGSLLLSPVSIPRLLKERAINREHKRRVDAIDRKGFGADGYELNPPAGCSTLRVSGSNILNQPETIAAISEMQPDLLILCGCSIVKEQLLAVPRLGTLNLHGGLSQKYRGIWTTLWAIINHEPEYVGATVHFVSPGIDDGDIVFQGRPDIACGDNHESLYVKVVQLGIDMMTAAVRCLQEGNLSRYPLEQKGRLYLTRMVTPDVLSEAWRRADGPDIENYLANRVSRDAPVLAMMRGIYPTETHD